MNVLELLIEPLKMHGVPWRCNKLASSTMFLASAKSFLAPPKVVFLRFNFGEFGIVIFLKVLVLIVGRRRDWLLVHISSKASVGILIMRYSQSQSLLRSHYSQSQSQKGGREKGVDTARPAKAVDTARNIRR